MSTSTSVAQEFYKIREEWARADKLKNWQLAIWIAGYQDIDIIDKFIETERLPVGVFDDIFFRFNTPYKGDPAAFEEALWNEYQSWFAEVPDPSQDLLLALKNEGILNPLFRPEFDTDSGFDGLLKEMLRLKDHLRGFEKNNFCLYFPPAKPHQFLLGNWLNQKLKKNIPAQIRLVTIDHAASRKIFINQTGKVIELAPRLNMLAAINNEMDKGGGSSDTVSPESRLTRQIRKVMDTIVKKDNSLTGCEVKKMLSLAKETGNSSTIVSTLLVASQAHYNIKDHEPSEQYAEDAIKKAEAEMDKGDASGYHSWKACMMLKGALLAAKRKWEAAIKVYEAMAEKALKYGDTFFIMEGYRISGHLYYLRGRLKPAFENCLLAMVAGSHLGKEMIRQSTFLHAAYLAVFLGEKLKPKDELQALENQLSTWIGEDWKELIGGVELEKSTVKPRGKYVPAVPF
ncbi:MAG: hypothetical protein QM640_07655 [Niabella sp.]